MENNKKTKKPSSSIYLEKYLWEKIAKQCKDLDRTKSKIIEFALIEYFDKRG